MASITKPITKFQPTDWHTSNFAIATNSERIQNASHDIRQEARYLRNETDVKTKWDQYDNTTRLADRIDAIRLWKEILEEDKEKLDRELGNLNTALDDLENRLESLNIPTDAVNECLTLRDSRTKIDNVEDEAENQLLKEQELIAKSKKRLQQKIDEAFEQRTLLHEARNQVLKDLQDKNVAMGIDINQYKLNEESPNISFKPDSTRVLPGSTTPQQWEDFSRYNHQRAAAELLSSQRLREAIHGTIHSVDNDLKAQKNASDYALRKRVRDMERTLDDLGWQKKNVEDEIAAMERDLQGLENSIRAKIPAAKLAQTRLENRKARPGVELCRDAPQYGLTDEVKQLEVTKAALLEKQRQARHGLDALEKQLHRVKDDIALKEYSLAIDKQCEKARERMESRPKTIQEDNLLMEGITRESNKVLPA